MLGSQNWWKRVLAGAQQNNKVQRNTKQTSFFIGKKPRVKDIAPLLPWSLQVLTAAVSWYLRESPEPQPAVKSPESQPAVKPSEPHPDSETFDLNPDVDHDSKPDPTYSDSLPDSRPPEFLLGPKPLRPSRGSSTRRGRPPDRGSSTLLCPHRSSRLMPVRRRSPDRQFLRRRPLDHQLLRCRPPDRLLHCHWPPDRLLLRRRPPDRLLLRRRPPGLCLVWSFNLSTWPVFRFGRLPSFRGPLPCPGQVVFWFGLSPSFRGPFHPPRAKAVTSRDPRTRRAQLGQNRMTLTRFLLCLLLFPFVSSAQVAPPTNVTLTCRSQKNILNWDYDRIVPGLRFLVKILSDSSLKGCRDEIWVDGPPLQANVSFLSDPDATYFLTVKAVLGKNESVPSPMDGLTFSYFHSSLAGQQCLLDLPPVNVTPQPHHQIQFQFKHPWLVYKEGLSGCKGHKNKKSYQRVSESKLPDFDYKVKMAGQERDHNFGCEDAVCEGRLQVDAAQDQHCLKIQGSLKKMSVESTNEYCALKTEPPHSHITLYTWISIIILMGAALVAFMVYRRMTSPSLDMPPPLVFGDKKHPLMPPDDLVSPVGSVSVSPREEDDDQSFTPSVPVPKEYEGRMKLKPEDPEKGNAADDDAAYMPGGNLASDDEEQESDQRSRSTYERRSVVLGLAPEDRAEGYRG
ncbi:hypothetical protein CHARACLAT_001012 [Characodon lateralis]|uniref:Fibronectin type-III domain-containing protein n=1 Tax=Characodon lateralis TaxID=208331 RepID=A0ABU7ET41_9TELE|nr:hypothetical protein [Characodon lateralis]